MASASAKVVELVREIQLIRWGNISGFALLIYHILLTLPQEIELIWKRKWTKPTALYFANRYLPFVQQCFTIYGFIGPRPNPKNVCDSFPIEIGAVDSNTPFGISLSCTGWIYFQLWCATVQIALMQSVLMYRLHALYRSKRVLAFMVISFLCSFISMAFIVSFAVGKTISVSEPIPGIHFCSASPSQHRSKLGIIWAYWIPIAAVEFVLFGLAAYQLYGNIMAFGIQSMTDSRGGLVSMILRDAVWYFGFAIVIDVANLVLNLTIHALGEFLPGLSSTAFSIIATRLILSLREVEQRRVNGTTMNSAPLEDIKFKKRKDTTLSTTLQNSGPSATIHDSEADDGARCKELEFMIRGLQSAM